VFNQAIHQALSQACNHLADQPGNRLVNLLLNHRRSRQVGQAVNRVTVQVLGHQFSPADNQLLAKTRYAATQLTMTFLLIASDQTNTKY